MIRHLYLCYALQKVHNLFLNKRLHAEKILEPVDFQHLHVSSIFPKRKSSSWADASCMFWVRVVKECFLSSADVGAVLALEAHHQALVGMVARWLHHVYVQVELQHLHGGLLFSQICPWFAWPAASCGWTSSLQQWQPALRGWDPTGRGSNSGSSDHVSCVTSSNTSLLPFYVSVSAILAQVDLW